MGNLVNNTHAAGPAMRDCHSSTFQLNLSHFRHGQRDANQRISQKVLALSSGSALRYNSYEYSAMTWPFSFH
jgi:hypothetical protein